MLNEIYDWFAGLATVGGFAYFMLGFFVSYAYWWFRCKQRHETVRLPWHYAGIAIGVIAIIITSLQSSQAFNKANTIAAQQAECNIQFRRTLIERAKTSKENDEYSEKQRRIVFEWLTVILFPPPPYKDMGVNDPERQQFSLSQTLQAQDRYRASIEAQDRVQAERDKHIYPDPTCGA